MTEVVISIGILVGAVVIAVVIGSLIALFSDNSDDIEDSRDTDTTNSKNTISTQISREGALAPVKSMYLSVKPAPVSANIEPQPRSRTLFNNRGADGVNIQNKMKLMNLEGLLERQRFISEIESENKELQNEIDKINKKHCTHTSFESFMEDFSRKPYAHINQYNLFSNALQTLYKMRILPMNERREILQELQDQCVQNNTNCMTLNKQLGVMCGSSFYDKMDTMLFSNDTPKVIESLLSLLTIGSGVLNWDYQYNLLGHSLREIAVGLQVRQDIADLFIKIEQLIPHIQNDYRGATDEDFRNVVMGRLNVVTGSDCVFPTINEERTKKAFNNFINRTEGLEKDTTLNVEEKAIVSNIETIIEHFITEAKSDDLQIEEQIIAKICKPILDEVKEKYVKTSQLTTNVDRYLREKYLLNVKLNYNDFAEFFLCKNNIEDMQNILKMQQQIKCNEQQIGQLRARPNSQSL